MLNFFNGSFKCTSDHLGESLVDFVNVRDSSVTQFLFFFFLGFYFFNVNFYFLKFKFIYFN